MDSASLLMTITAFRSYVHPYRPDWTRAQILYMYGSIALALIVWKLIEVLLRKHAKKLDKKHAASSEALPQSSS